MSGISASPNMGLSKLFAGYKNNEFVADFLAPIATAKSKAPFYYRNRLGTKTEHSSLKVSSLGTPVLKNGTLDLVNVTLDGHAIVEAFPRDTALELSESADAVQFVRDNVIDALLLDREQRVATKFTTSGNYSSAAGAASPGTKWASATVAQVLSDVNTGIQAIPGVVKGNLQMIMGYDAFNALIGNANLQARFQYTGSKAIDPDMLAQFFGIGKIHLGMAKVNSTTLTDDASPTIVNMWSDHCVLFKPSSSDDSGLMASGFARTFRFPDQDLEMPIYEGIEQVLGGGAFGAHLIKGALIESAEMTLPKLGYLLYDCVA